MFLVVVVAVAVDIIIVIPAIVAAVAAVYVDVGVVEAAVVDDVEPQANHVLSVSFPYSFYVRQNHSFSLQQSFSAEMKQKVKKEKKIMNASCFIFKINEILIEKTIR